MSKISRLDNNIRVAASVPGLKDKIRTNVLEDSEEVVWYIRFNIPLDSSAVTQKTMSVMDTDGYIMATEISYADENNMISISPLDSYEQNRYYILNISKQVKSLKGQHLKKKIHILFKLVNNRIADYQVIKNDASVPKPRPRPKGYGKASTKSKVYSYDKNIFDGLPQDKLPPGDIRINPILGVAGVMLTFGSVFFDNLTITLVCAGVGIIGVGHIIYQIIKKELRSILIYNKGARAFNKAKYTKAEKAFKSAIRLNPGNELAEYALSKVSFYL